jgi:cytochrome c biogenesis protein CcmG/thiol:disulfide interchange protein DsbE
MFAPALSWNRMSRILRLFRFGALGLLASLLGLLVWSIVSDDPGAGFTTSIRNREEPPSPPFELPVLYRESSSWPVGLTGRLTDGRVALGELRGWPVVINFYASYCVPCKDEAPVFRQASARLREKVVFLAIDTQDFSSDGHRFMHRHSLPFVAVYDGKGSTAKTWGLRGIPETFVLDASGRAVAHLVGRVSADGLNEALRSVSR